MKKILLGFAILSAGFAKAQLTEANHAPNAGDVFSTYQCDSTGVTVGASGAGATWDFSTLVVHTSMLNNYTSTVSTNPSNMGYLEVKSSITNSSYYSSTPTNLSYYGGNIVAGSYNATVNYTVPAIVAVYPMNLNSTSTNTTSGNATITGFGTFPFTGNCTVTEDGSGTLMLSGRTFTNAVRLKTTQVLSVNGGMANVTLTTWDYYSIADSKRPIVSISSSTLSSIAGTSTQSVVTLQANHTVLGVQEAAQNIANVSVFPNPAVNDINFTTASNEAVKVLAFDVTGKLVAEKAFENAKATMNVSSLNQGVYFYSIVDKNNQVLLRGKFTVGK